MKTLFQSTQGDDLRQSVEALIGRPVELTVFHTNGQETEVVIGPLASLFHYKGGNRGSDTLVRVDDARIHVGPYDDWTLRLLGAATPIQGVAIDAMIDGRNDGRRPAEIVRRMSGDAWIVRYVDGFGATREVARFASEIHADPEILEQMREMPFAGV